MIVTTQSVEETVGLGRRIGAAWIEMSGGRVLCVALDGPLGAGKTQLTRGIAEGAGVADVSLVSSPTYVIMNIYDGPVRVYHLDAYRLAGVEEAEGLGLEEIFCGEAGGAIVVVEWAERIAAALPGDRVRMMLQHGDEGQRQVEMEGLGEMSRAVVERAVREMGKV